MTRMTIFIHACLEQKIGSPPCYMLYNTVWVHTRGGYESMRRTSLALKMHLNGMFPARMLASGRSYIRREKHFHLTVFQDLWNLGH